MAFFLISNPIVLCFARHCSDHNQLQIESKSGGAPNVEHHHWFMWRVAYPPVPFSFFAARRCFHSSNSLCISSLSKDSRMAGSRHSAMAFISCSGIPGAVVHFLALSQRYVLLTVICLLYRVMDASATLRASSGTAALSVPSCILCF